MMEEKKRQKVCVVGGGGFVGCCVGRELERQGYDVHLFDVHFLTDQLPPKATLITGDIRKLGDLQKAFRGCDAVFHLAAYGMSGNAACLQGDKVQANRQLTEEINVGGTEKVVEGCVREGVARLLYSSSVQVVFGGQEIIDGKEDQLPYWDSDKHSDHYSRTKTIAEQIVLKANGRPLNRREEGKEDILRTTALRLSGVYGLGEQRHQPRAYSYTTKGLYMFTYGRGDSVLIDFASGENVAQAFRKAYEVLNKEHKYVTAGKAYFINDGEPIDGFEFFRYITDIIVPFPKVRLPYWLMYGLAILMEVVMTLLPYTERWFGLHLQPPGITRVEVNTLGIQHYFSIEKAKRDFGYDPQNPNDMSEVREFYRKLMIKEGRKVLIPVAYNKDYNKPIDAQDKENTPLDTQNKQQVVISTGKRNNVVSIVIATIVALWFLILVPLAFVFSSFFSIS